MFNFKQDLPASKSWMNRALIIQYFNPNIKIVGTSDSGDVLVLKKSIEKIGQTNEFYLGLGGTSLRFFSFLISRFKGEFVLKAEARLLERPQSEIKTLLNQIGVDVEIKKDCLIIKSSEWQLANTIHCDAKQSSQFVSGLLLSCWNLPKEIKLKIAKPIVSEDYLRMTISLLQSSGMKLLIDENEFEICITVASKQSSSVLNLQAELDVSSAFALIAAAAVDGNVKVTNWNSKSIQPDMAFKNIFKMMQIEYSESINEFKISKQNLWQACKVNLNKCPDLFPVLSVLCALAQGTSELFGAEQLKSKESDRIAKTTELLKRAGFIVEAKEDGLVIQGRSSRLDKSQKIVFNPDHDHRMAMAAGILRLAGFNIELQNPDVVNKSYPQFWQHIGIQP